MKIPFTVVSSTQEGHCFLALASKDHSFKIMALLDSTPDLQCIGFTKRDYFIAGSQVFLHCTLFEVTLKEGVKLPPTLYLETYATAEMADIIDSL